MFVLLLFVCHLYSTTFYFFILFLNKRRIINLFVFRVTIVVRIASSTKVHGNERAVIFTIYPTSRLDS